MHLDRRSVLGLVAANALAAITARAQVQQPVTAGPPQMPQSIQDSPKMPGLDRDHEQDIPGSPMGERMKISAEKAHNDDRRKRMLEDTNKLLSLSTELKADIEKANKDELSLEVIRKAQQIEKLAHDVQQRMKN